MKAIILSAGKGTRLMPLTKNTPKVMLEIGNKPLLQYHIEWLAKNGIKDIGINLHHCPDVIKGYFNANNNFGVNLCYSFEPEILGTSGGLKQFEDFIGNEQCLVIYGDNLFELDFKDLEQFHKNKGGIVTICTREWEDPTSKGIIETDENCQIKLFKEKPPLEEVVSNHGNAGIYLIEPKVFSYIKKNDFSDFGKDVFPKMISCKEKLFAYKLKGYHEDIGTIEMLEKVRRDVFLKSHTDLA